MKKSILVISLLLALFVFAQCATEQAPEQTAPARVSAPVSPVVNADRTITFNLLAPTADSVSVNITAYPETIPMTCDENGIWSGTAGPLEPEIWEYSFVVNGVSMIDPGNAWIDERRLPAKSMMEVPGSDPAFYGVGDVPHGIVSVHTFKSPSIGDMRMFQVYTPPGYDKTKRDTYPVLYLMHGGGNDERGWTVMGRANYILDNLLAEGESLPMIVVMPNGQYPRTTGFNAEGYEQDLLEIIIPTVEREYRVKTDSRNRAMAGLSMGGFHTLYIGVKHPELFTRICVLSSGIRDTEQRAAYEDEYGKYFDTMNDNLGLFWIGMGEDDALVKAGYDGLIALLDKRGVKYSSVMYSGAHTWDVWRKSLRDFAPILFR
ncbi:alpha/beta hydrolase-fold protein [Candidatus Latescibacterota bacterium]